MCEILVVANDMIIGETIPAFLVNDVSGVGIGTGIDAVVAKPGNYCRLPDNFEGRLAGQATREP